jgi:UPF0176 protein
MYSVAALYKFSTIKNPELLHNEIRIKLKKLSIYGTILVGEEGLNGTISGSENNLNKAIDYLKSIDGFSNIDIKFSKSFKNPFIRLKIKLKEEIVNHWRSSL